MKRSNFVRLLYDICGEEKIEIESFSGEWAHRLTKDGKVRYIVGYQFPLNNASAKELCQDKALTYGLLRGASVPAVPHIFLPSRGTALSMDREDMKALAGALIREKGRAVLKDNSGTGGNRVFLIKDVSEMDEALDRIFAGSYGAALSPFLEISEEYRVTMLGTEPLLTIRKQRASIAGDGESTLEQLILEEPAYARYLKNFTGEELARVPEEGERVWLTWKHNLGQGATGVIEEDREVLNALHPIAVSAVRVLGTGFVSVDIVLAEGRYQVLEVNGGVMMEHLSGQDPLCYERARCVYARAIRKMFGEDPDDRGVL